MAHRGAVLVRERVVMCQPAHWNRADNQYDWRAFYGIMATGAAPAGTAFVLMAGG